jgi:hypothetical protein
MSELQIDFEWPVAKCEFRPATAEEVRRYRDDRDHPLSLMEDMPEDALWPELSEAEWPLFFGHIVPRGKFTIQRPKAKALEYAVGLLVYAKKTPFHEVALKVVRTIGPLDPEVEEGDQVCLWYARAHRLRLIFQGKDHKKEGELYTWLVKGKEYIWPGPEYPYDEGNLKICLVPGKDNEPALALRPNMLDDALLLCAARMIATGTTFNICEHCKTPFLSGGTRFRNKRGDAKFCSDECRWRWHNESRRRAR